MPHLREPLANLQFMAGHVGQHPAAFVCHTFTYRGYAQEAVTLPTGACLIPRPAKPHAVRPAAHLPVPPLHEAGSHVLVHAARLAGVHEVHGGVTVADGQVERQRTRPVAGEHFVVAGAGLDQHALRGMRPGEIIRVIPECNSEFSS